MRHRSIFIPSAVLIVAASAFCQTTTQAILNNLPSRVLGHPNPEQIANVVTGAPNLVEGRELFQPQGIALDTTVTPAIVYVADTLNNRVLAWKNATGFTNGAPADMVIGQNDPFSTFPQGPGGSTLLTGFAEPSGLTVYKGDLYVVDSGNNRVLRFPTPFSQTQKPVVPDLVIGQPNLTSRTTNYASTLSTTVTEQGIYTASFNSTNGQSTVFTAGLAFDASGNLWFTDAGNGRVLRYPAANIPAPNVGNTVGGIKADLVIGQPSLTSLNPTALGSQLNPMLIKNQFGLLSTLGFDPKGRLYIVDSYGDGTTAFGRVLVFATPSTIPAGNGSADRVMGVVPTGELATLGINKDPIASNLFELQTWMVQPNGIFFFPDGGVGILDTGDNRILTFPSYDKWVPESTNYSPLAIAVTGQGGSTNYTSLAANNAQTASLSAGTPPASGSTLWAPSAAAFLPATNELFVADRNNNRVIVMPQVGSSFGSATRVLGQDLLTANSPNLIEGREFQFLTDAGMALDTTGAVPHLYVSDPYNNRVLGYYDARLVAAGKQADLVIGQPDFKTALCNYNPSAPNGRGGDATLPTQSSLCLPTGLAVDQGGNLYVADTDNGRVMRFSAPFAQSAKGVALQPADLVLGQPGFTAQIKQAGNATMVSPYGLAFSGTKGLLVSDATLNRVLYFQFTANGTFTALSDNGKAATKVFGQPDFVSRAPGAGAANLNRPLHLASDGEGNFYVADVGNSRVSIFPDPSSSFNPSGIADSYTITGLGSPRGVWVNPITDEIWITDTTNNQCLRYPRFNTFYAGVTYNLAVPAVSATLALATDLTGALYVADATNRVAIYYPALQAMNGANFLPNRPLAPGLIASLCAPASNCTTGDTAFGSQTVNNSQVPVPTVLGDIQVNFNGTLAPLFYVSPAQINFYVPSNAPQSGTALIEVSLKSTGQVIAAGQAAMSNVSPGIFMQAFTSSTRQAAVLNEDNSVNSSTNPAQRGHLIQIYATGQGLIPGMPADGVPPATQVTVPATLTNVLIGSCLVTDGSTQSCPNQPGDVSSGGKWIPFSGLSPNYPGVLQVNAQIPMATVPNQPAILKVVIHGTASSDPLPGFQTVIYVK